MKKERRSVESAEIRVDADSRTIVGRIPYDSETVIGGWFREVIRPGFFKRAIAEGDDIVAQAQHGEGYLPFARTKAGNLDLIDHRDHLEWRAEAIEAADVDELLARIRSGVIDATSFAFTVDDDDNDQVHWDRSEKDKLPLRELKSANRIYDVAPVVFAAYESTGLGLRSAESVLQDHVQSLEWQEPESDDAKRAEEQELEDAQRVMDLIRLQT